MPAYEICYRDGDGALTHSFIAHCDDDVRARVLAHAMKLPSVQQFDVWQEGQLVYARPPRQAVPERRSA